MNAPAPARRDRLRAMLADLKMPGALEAVDGILSDADGGTISAAEAIEQLLNAQIVLRNNRRLQTAMRSSRRPAVKTLNQFDFAFQPSIKREQIESLHELGFLDRGENVILLGPPGVGENALGDQPRDRGGRGRPARLLRHARGADRVPHRGQGRRQSDPAVFHHWSEKRRWAHRRSCVPLAPAAAPPSPRPRRTRNFAEISWRPFAGNNETCAWEHQGNRGSRYCGKPVSH